MRVAKGLPEPSFPAGLLRLHTMLASLIAIAVLHWAVLVIPGFNFVLIGQLAAGGSRVAAMAAVAGMTSATLAWATLAVAGVGIVFTAHPTLRHVAQLAGGLYLLHLALKLWRSGRQATSAAAPVLGSAAAFRAGFTTSALNPKIALFYGSVFATALPENPSYLMVTLAVLLVFANSVVWHSSLALVLSRPTVQAAYLRHFQALNRFSGVLVGAYGGKLIVSAVSEFRSRAA
jgi:threonine efflux protein